MNISNKSTPLGKEWVFTFGKYKGEVLKDIIITDLKYVRWCMRTISWFIVDRGVLNIIVSIASYEDYMEEDGYDNDLSDIF